MFYRDRFTFWQACIKLKSAPTQRDAHITHINTHPSQKEFALIDNQTGIVNTIICRQNKRKQSKITKAKPCIKVIGGPSPITRREEAMVEGGGKI
jgi:hypothetical protein